MISDHSINMIWLSKATANLLVAFMTYRRLFYWFFVKIPGLCAFSILTADSIRRIGELMKGGKCFESI